VEDTVEDTDATAVPSSRLLSRVISTGSAGIAIAFGLSMARRVSSARLRLLEHPEHEAADGGVSLWARPVDESVAGALP